MGAYTCEYGTVHKMCRCPTPHTIICPTPKACQEVEDVLMPQPYHTKTPAVVRPQSVNERYEVFWKEGQVELRCLTCTLSEGDDYLISVGYHPSLDVLNDLAIAHDLKAHS